VTADARVEDLLRELAPRVLGVLVRRYEDFAGGEDAVQDVLVAAAQHSATEGVPSYARSWLVTAAGRAVVDEWRSVRARRRQEATVAALEPPDQAAPSGQDDSLALLLMCCHPVLPVPAQLALTLRAVGGLTTAEIARAFLVPQGGHGQAHQPRQAAAPQRRRPV
jgi:predicted RNA polymerase sigma factor